MQFRIVRFTRRRPIASQARSGPSQWIRIRVDLPSRSWERRDDAAHVAGKRDAAIGQICFQFREHADAGRPRLLARSVGRRERLYHSDFDGAGSAASDVDFDAPWRRMYKKLEPIFI